MKVKGDYFLTSRAPQPAHPHQHPPPQSRLPHRFVPPAVASPHTSPVSIVLDSHSFAAPPLAHHLLRDSISISDYYSDPEPGTVASQSVTVAFGADADLFGAQMPAAPSHTVPAPSPQDQQLGQPLDVHNLDAVAVRTARYQRAIELIVAKCETLSADNERLVHRLHYVKRITRRKERDVALLKRRLDVFGDGWRTAQPEPQTGAASQHPTLIPADNNVIVRKKYKKREKPGAAGVSAELDGAIEQQQLPELQQEQQQLDEDQGRIGLGLPSIEALQPPVQPVAETLSSIPGTVPTAATQPHHQFLQPSHISMCPPTHPFLKPIPATVIAKCAKEPRRKRPRIERADKDPNAPKRPANPFFQFCQEQRSILMGELNSELLPGQPELSKQELTRQLANRWRSLDMEAKQIYINMYENSKQKYNEEMQSYRDGGRGMLATGGKVGAKGKATVATATAVRQRQGVYVVGEIQM